MFSYHSFRNFASDLVYRSQLNETLQRQLFDKTRLLNYEIHKLIVAKAFTIQKYSMAKASGAHKRKLLEE